MVSPAGVGDTSLENTLPPLALLLGRAGTENFPVASRYLPRALRDDLMAIYGWARLVDQLGDDYAGDRLAALDLVDQQLRSALRNDPSPLTHPAVSKVASAARRIPLPTASLLDLVQANRQDQLVQRYETFDDLLGYCRLSADPVGRLVLAAFSQATPEHIGWSDRICTALQLVEHWQDVAEDAVVGRVYLPIEDLERFGVDPAQLLPPAAGETLPADRVGSHPRHRTSPELRALMAFECARARSWLRQGEPLVAALRGRLRLAVAGFVAGGHATLDAMAAADFDPFADPARRSAVRSATWLGRLTAASLLTTPRTTTPAGSK